jgi:hypothetical protein
MGKMKKDEGMGALAGQTGHSRRGYPTQNGFPSSFNRPQKKGTGTTLKV